MRAPDFWYEEPGIAAGLLTPVGAALDAAGRLRRAVARPYCAPVPVICVGNLVAGGSGKTPVALSLAEMLAARGIKTAIVMRGYGGKLGGPVRIDPERHDAEAVGDEALLAATQTASWVARDRAAGVRAAVTGGAEAIILDDGFQNPHVAKDLSLVVVDAAAGFGNCRLIPAGPLRERVAAGLARADAVVLVEKEEEPRVSETESLVPAPTHLPLTRHVSLPRGHGGGPGRGAAPEIPILRVSLAPTDGQRFAGAKLLAFAGIGRPEKFFASLRAIDADLVGARDFPDHHPYRAAELAALRRDAEAARARLVTTRKDWVRLSPPERTAVEVLDVAVRWHDPAARDALLAPVLARISELGRAIRA
jgi:tetraacyldisaccharide 4'-kinase